MSHGNPIKSATLGGKCQLAFSPLNSQTGYHISTIMLKPNAPKDMRIKKWVSLALPTIPYLRMMLNYYVDHNEVNNYVDHNSYQ